MTILNRCSSNLTLVHGLKGVKVYLTTSQKEELKNILTNYSFEHTNSKDIEVVYGGDVYFISYSDKGVDYKWTIGDQLVSCEITADHITTEKIASDNLLILKIRKFNQ